jgi:hypothetical protein
MSSPVISPDQTSIAIDGKNYEFRQSPQQQAGSCDCDHCAFLNHDFCGKAPCDIERKDGKIGYFKLVKA